MSVKFTKMAELDESTVMIVDSLNLAFRYKHSGQLDFADDYIKTVTSLQRSYKAKYVVMASDIGSSSYRKELYPGYKGGRKETFEEQSEEEKLAFELFFAEFKRTIQKIQELGVWPVLQFDKTEADDIAAYICKHKEQFGIQKVVLISSDRDWDLLINPDVMRFSYVTRKEITFENWSEHYAWTIEDHISVKCLQGDSGDSVPGIEKVGPANAMKLLAKYGTAMDLAFSIPIPAKYVYEKNTNTFGREAILLNYQLMDLLTYCEEALGENTKIIDKVLNEYFAN